MASISTVEFGDPKLHKWTARWRKEWPGVSIMTWSLMPDAMRRLLREYLDEDDRTPEQIKAFIAGMYAWDGRKRS